VGVPDERDAGTGEDPVPARPWASAAGSPDAARAAVATAHRTDWALVLSATMRVTRDIDLAEECVQDAYVSALAAWTRAGVPANPAAWLTTTARRKALDALRRDKTLRAKLPLLIEPGLPSGPAEPEPPADGEDIIPDDRLRLVFTCCHPALGREAQVALALRLICGLTTAEIAAAFLVPEPTMAARVTRAKKKIIAARISYRVPGAAELPERLDAVLTVIHLVFTTGHTAPAGESLVRDELVEQAIRLARMVAGLMPDEREALGLLALLVLTHARRATRTDDHGRLLLLSEQDRARWDRPAIGEGAALVRAALRGPARPGRFAAQAAIAAVHAQAPDYVQTDWPLLVVRYDDLLRSWPSPVVELNRAVAVAMAAGPDAGLAEIARIEADGRLAGYRYLHAAKADLLVRAGRRAEAVLSYRAALELTQNEAERAFLTAAMADANGTADTDSARDRGDPGS
jgi:RNA polymerase sigma-70 factor, ECF subfamily